MACRERQRESLRACWASSVAGTPRCVREGRRCWQGPCWTVVGGLDGSMLWGEVEGSSQNVQQGAVFKKKIHEKNWEPFHSTTSGLGNQWILIFLDVDSCERRQCSVTKLSHERRGRSRHGGSGLPDWQRERERGNSNQPASQTRMRMRNWKWGRKRAVKWRHKQGITWAEMFRAHSRRFGCVQPAQPSPSAA